MRWVHVEDAGGSGRPVVLISVWPLSLESWRNQINVLADAGFRVVAHDPRGFGSSDKPGGGLTTARSPTIVFAAAIPPAMMKSVENPGGPLTPQQAEKVNADLTADRDAFFNVFTKQSFKNFTKEVPFVFDARNSSDTVRDMHYAMPVERGQGGSITGSHMYAMSVKWAMQSAGIESRPDP